MNDWDQQNERELANALDRISESNRELASQFIQKRRNKGVTPHDFRHTCATWKVREHA